MKISRGLSGKYFKDSFMGRVTDKDGSGTAFISGSMFLAGSAKLMSVISANIRSYFSSSENARAVESIKKASVAARIRLFNSIFFTALAANMIISVAFNAAKTPQELFVKGFLLFLSFSVMITPLDWRSVSRNSLFMKYFAANGNR